MSGTIQEVDAQRARWRRYRRQQGLTLDAGERFGCNGLGGRVDGLEIRLLFLPADPEGDAVPLDSEVLAWLKETRNLPHGHQAPRWGDRARAMNDALVLYDSYRDAGWARYLAIHRHGGLEVGIGHVAYQINEVRIFPLRAIVGLTWAAAAIYADAAQRWSFDGPVEATTALRHTQQATLGGFAEGWAEPGRGLWDFARCLDDHLLLRREADGALDPETHALDLGDRLEQAFGTVHRRHLAHKGDYEGRFDPRFHVF